MGLEISYFKESDNILRHPYQLFGDNNFTVTIDKSHSQSIDTRFYVDLINDTIYRLKIDEENVSLYNYLDNKIISSGHTIKLDTLCHFNQIVTTPYFKFSVSRNTDSYKKGPDDELSISGTITGKKNVPRFIAIDKFEIDMVPSKHMAFISYKDIPGQIGKIGTEFGKLNVNIAAMHVGRKKMSGDAVMGLNLDTEVTSDMADEFSKASGFKNIKIVNLY